MKFFDFSCTENWWNRLVEYGFFVTVGIVLLFSIYNFYNGNIVSAVFCAVVVFFSLVTWYQFSRLMSEFTGGVDFWKNDSERD